MAEIISNYNTGNDTTGNGTHATPYKTLAKSVSVMSAGDICSFEAAEPVGSAITLPIYTDSTKISIIRGINSSGIDDGTRVALTSASLASLFTVSSNTYAWSFRNISFEGFTTNVFNASAWSQGHTIFNCRFYQCASVGTASTNYRGAILEDCEFDSCATGAGASATLLNSYGGSLRNCKFINCSSAAAGGTMIAGSTGGVDIFNTIFKGCTVATGSIVGGGSRLHDCIIDNCVSTGLNSKLLSITAPSQCYNLLITNCSHTNGSSTSAYIIYLATSSGLQYCRNIALYNNTGFNNTIVAVATGKGIVSNAPIALASDPWADNTNLILAPDYPWRRFAQKIGEFNYLPTVI